MKLPDLRQQMEAIGFDNYVKAATLLRNDPTILVEEAVERTYKHPEHVDFDAELFTASVIDKLQDEIESIAAKPERQWLLDDSFVRGMLWMLLITTSQDIGRERAES